MDSNVEVFIVVAVAIGAAGLVFWKKHGLEVMRDVNSFLALPWLAIGIILLSSIFLFLITWNLRRWLNQRKEDKQEEEKQRLQRLNEIKSYAREDFSQFNSSQVMSRLDVIKKKLLKYPKEEVAQFQQLLDDLCKRAPLIVKQKQIEEELARQRKLEAEAEERRRIALEKRREEEKLRRFENVVEELVQYKIKVRNPKSIPANSDYSEHVLQEASFRARQYFEEQDWLKWKREEATDYYSRYDIDSVPQLKDPKEVEVFLQVRSEIKSGALCVDKKAGLEYNGQRLEKVFYRARDLTKEQKIRAQKQGFEFIRGKELDSHLSGGFYIQRGDSQETPYHFYMKHLFAELHENMQIEKEVKDRRVDVYLNIEDYKVAIEIETGTNKLDDLAEKTAWLNENFDCWIYVCKKDLLPRYSQFVDGKKSFALTPKKAKKMVEEICYYH
ncbi:hypothetical protein JW898_02540 [Candidatus Woesearchaeota archaeon]|nr:hypothetical protein [Candidatus Woesearchaeota archaeon]